MAQDWKDMLASLSRESVSEDSEAKETQTEIKVPAAAELPTLHIILDRKGRKGKTATIIEGFTASDSEIEAIASELKRKIGTGGSARGGEILLQGDWKEKATALLKDKGYNVK